MLTVNYSRLEHEVEQRLLQESFDLLKRAGYGGNYFHRANRNRSPRLRGCTPTCNDAHLSGKSADQISARKLDESRRRAASFLAEREACEVSEIQLLRPVQQRSRPGDAHELVASAGEGGHDLVGRLGAIEGLDGDDVRSS